MAAPSQQTAFVAAAGNATLATALTSFNTAFAAIVAATQATTPPGAPPSIVQAGLEVTANSQAAGVAWYQPWAIVQFYA